MSTFLHIESSARTEGSVSRDLSSRLAQHLSGDRDIVVRDVGQEPIPHINEAWVKANFTPVEARTEADRQALSLSDSLVDELSAADTIIIGVPVYNFSVPASLKAWIDQVARVGRTFRYTERGPEGLLKNKTAYLVVSSGGTALDSDIDFATPYLRHVLGFMGITDVQVVDATRWGFRSEADKTAVLDALTGQRTAA